MRTLRLFGCDLRYQFKYGFFFLYALMTVIYVAIISLLPMEWRQLGAALVILTDPATLGFMFIGGILLLEKGEGLHGYLAILPVRISEYVAAKSLSLATISTLAGLLIARLSLPGGLTCRYWLCHCWLVRPCSPWLDWQWEHWPAQSITIW